MTTILQSLCVLHNLNFFTRIRIRDHFDPGSGMEKIRILDPGSGTLTSRIRSTIIYIPLSCRRLPVQKIGPKVELRGELRKHFFGLKKLKFFDVEPDPGSFISGSGMEKFGSRIRSTDLLTFTLQKIAQKWVRKWSCVARTLSRLWWWRTPSPAPSPPSPSPHPAAFSPSPGARS
jgi:hypothetical protein